jgi:hypothetical protein
MHLNADFTKRAVVHAAKASPMPGVERRMLDRIGRGGARHEHSALCARSQFSPHVHDGGEEFLVLDDVCEGMSVSLVNSDAPLKCLGQRLLARWNRPSHDFSSAGDTRRITKIKENTVLRTATDVSLTGEFVE